MTDSDPINAITADVSLLGGFLRCETCGHNHPLDEGYIAGCFRAGWPQCCGYTMRWWTRRQVDAGEVPAMPWRPDRGFPAASGVSS